MKRLLLAVTFALTALAALAAAPLAAAPHWVPLGPYGGRVDTLTADPATPQVLYATAADQGSFKSTDAGATWSQIHTGPVSGNVAVDPVQPTTLYQAFNLNQVLKSTDGGATWRASSRGLAQAMIAVTAVDPTRHTRVFVAGNGVWRSLDGGVSWNPARQGLPKGFAGLIDALAVSPSGTLYAATNSGVFKSLDAGNSWQPARQGLPAGDLVLALALAPANPQILWATTLISGGVFRTTDGGASWSATANPAATIVTSLAVDPGDPAKATAGTFDHGIYRTTDAGAHWTPAGPRAAAEVPAVAATATSVYASIVPDYLDPGGVLASSDGGATWQPRNTGLHALTTFDLGIDPHHPESLWAAAGVTGLYHSSAGGLTWDLSAQPQAPPFDPLAPPFTVGAAFSADGAHFYTVFFSELWGSDDAGASWRVLLGLGTTALDTIASVLTHPADASTVYARSYRTIYGSHDSGATWQTVGHPGFACALAGVALAPSDPATLYALGSNTPGITSCVSVDSLSRSTDGGASWTKADAPLKGSKFFSLAVDPLDARTIYAQTSRGLMKSTDGGVTWFKAGKSTSGELLFSADGGTLWEARGTQVFASHNGGATWQSLGGPQTLIRRLIADPANPDRLYAATSGGVWVLEP